MHLQHHEHDSGQNADAHAGHVELGHKVLADEPGKEGILLGEHAVQGGKLLTDHIGNEALLAVAEEPEKLLIGNVHTVAVEHHIGKSAEGIHAGQRGNKRRNPDLGNPESLERADGKADGQHGQDGQPHVCAGCHHGAAHSRREADHGADGQVNVAARQNAQKHAGGQHKYVGVLGNQTGHHGRLEYLSLLARPECKGNGHNHQGDGHGVFLEKLTHALPAVRRGFSGFRPVFTHGHTPLPDRRMAAIMFSWVASSAFISPTILASFMI